ncbi:DUF86 domain-containing protein [Aquimarina sp. ERC-38]|uniref:HepT-like ribonuclease domain-containing protein n=1 Tax=Aquimarina sp. ERC-38 TaxID=2949996 RepID=UPI0022464AEF|nr:DUF86 domain-containing protein [Aquimarina sp. ERC-38]UZO81732.1 DUF86 domain-containing protein [Aquimarina sp. ERC-38]
MDNKIHTWLEDIDRCINEIFDFLPEECNFLVYKDDLKTKKAVERNLEIIGEAINRISKYKYCNIQIGNAEKIIGTRNRIAHEYDAISDEIIWTIIIRELPKLQQEIVLLRKKY